MINLSIKAKIELLKNDPLENSLERVLNFGHTLAHPIETINKNIEISHGRAVSIGIACATRFAFAKGFCSKATLLRILDVLRNVGLPTTLDTFDYQKLYKAIEMVVKVRDGNMNLVIPQEIGRPLIIRDVSIHELIDCIV
jgi:3-dehydroquinate synthase